MNGTLAKHLIWSGVILTVAAMATLVALSYGRQDPNVLEIAQALLLVAGPVTGVLGVVVHLISQAKESKHEALSSDPGGRPRPGPGDPC